MGQLHKQIKHAIDISMGTKKLRELITALAIQGKIVPQVLSEGTASDLINANKDYGVNSKKNSWKKLSRIIPVSPPYQIPASWIWIRLQDVCEVNGGFAFQSSRYVNDGIRVVRISDFDDRGFKNDSIVRYDYSAKLEGYLLNINNIIMAMTGGTVGKSYLVKSIPEKMVVNQRVATIRISKYAIPDYIHFVIKSRLTQGFINSAKNSTNDNISMLDINSFWIPLPPIMEQKRIVEKVDHLMALCDKIDELQLTKDSKLLSAHSASIKSLLESKNADEFSSSWEFIFSNFDVFYSSKENVEELKKAILTLAMKGKLVRSKQDAHYEWNKGKLGDFFQFEYGKSLPSSMRSNSGEFPVFGSNGIVGTHNKALVNAPCLIIGRKGSAGAIMLSNYKGCFVTDVAFYCVPKPSVDLSYAYHLLCSLDLSALSKGIKPGINRNEVYNLRVMIPRLNEQKLIVSGLERVFQLIERLKSKLDESTSIEGEFLESLLKSVVAS